MLTMTEAAARLNVCRSTLYYRAKTGQMPVVRVGNRPRILASWVADKLAADIADMQARAGLTAADTHRAAG